MPTAVVTGGSQGLGEAYARTLAARGYSLILVARNAMILADTAHRIREDTGAAVETIAADLTDSVQLARVEQRLGDVSQPVELLVNNAGVACESAFTLAAVEDLTYEVDLNVIAVLRLSRAVLPVMTALGRGGVMNVTGPAGYGPHRGVSTNATTAWTRAFADAVGPSLGGSGVHIMTVHVGRVRTDGGRSTARWPTPQAVAERSLLDLARGRRLSTPDAIGRMRVADLVLRRCRPGTRSAASSRPGREPSQAGS